MDELLKWLVGLLIPFFTYFFFVAREVKEIFFDKDDSGETFGYKLKRVFMPWKHDRNKKIKEPHSVIYTDEEREVAINNLFIHNFFIYISNMKNNMPTVDFGSRKKSLVLREVILIYVTTIEKYTHDFLKNHKLDEINTGQLNELLIEEIKKIEFEIYGRIREKLGDAIYNKVIEDPIKGFKVRNAIFKEIFLNGILLISSQAMSVYGYDNYNRASEVLTSMYISIQTIVKNFEKVFKDFNGELEKLLEEN